MSQASHIYNQLMEEAPLGGLSPQVFLRRYWQKRPLLVRRALPGFRGVIGKAALFALAARDDIESRLVQRGQERTGRGGRRAGSLPARGSSG